MTGDTREFAIEHLRRKRDALTHDGKRYVRLATDSRADAERYEQMTVTVTQQIESIDELLAEVGENANG